MKILVTGDAGFINYAPNLIHFTNISTRRNTLVDARLAF
ncbi:MAG: hypothetical protein RLY20_945 [Verrucomicrobiota bacterium]|jgi:hypothetical protein